MIGPIGNWVLNQACSDALKWPDHVKVAVNLSPVQFNKTLVLDVISALSKSGLAPKRLELEITETVLLQDTEPTIAVLNQLHDLGVRIVMDDFGTGHSSLCENSRLTRSRSTARSSRSWTRRQIQSRSCAR